MNNTDLIVDRPTHSVVTIGAETASRWLDQNTHNRPIRKGNVYAIMADMREGRWQFDGAPIRFSKTGRLLDGQHRLTALANTPGVQVPFLVVRGLEDNTQQVMDQGAKRDARGQLALNGVPNANVIAPFMRLWLLHERGLLFKDANAKQGITTALVEQKTAGNPDAVRWVSERIREVRPIETSPTTALYAWFCCAQVDSDAAEEYFHGLSTGAGLAEGDPALVIRNYLANAKMAHRRVSQRQALELLFRGFNARLKGTRWKRTISLKNYGEHDFPWPA